MQYMRLYVYACLLYERWVYLLCCVACISFSSIFTTDLTSNLKKGIWFNATGNRTAKSSTASERSTHKTPRVKDVL